MLWNFLYMHIPKPIKHFYTSGHVIEIVAHLDYMEYAFNYSVKDLRY